MGDAGEEAFNFIVFNFRKPFYLRLTGQTQLMPQRGAERATAPNHLRLQWK